MAFKMFWVQVIDLTLASIKSRYRKTFAGFIWVILNPLLMFGVQSLVFKKFMKMDIPDYYLYLLGGLLPWIFISSTIQMGTPVFIAQAHLLKSFKINPLVLLASQVLDNFINFMASFFIILLPFYFFSDRSAIALAYMPMVLIPLLVGTCALTLTMSLLNVFYRDINFIMSFAFSLLFFITPIFYPRGYVTEEWQWMVDYNPFTYFIEPFRTLLWDVNRTDFWIKVLESFGVALLSCVITVLTWQRRRNGFYRKL